MKSLEVITVGNGSKEYPGNFTKKEIHLIKDICKDKYALHLFSGKSTIGDVRVDFTQPEATHKGDVFEFLETYKGPHFNIVILDPPYNSRFADKYQKLGDTPSQFVIFANSKKTTILLNLIRETIQPDIIIMKSWNYYIPKGYTDVGSYLCYAGGYRKSTILMICRRVKL